MTTNKGNFLKTDVCVTIKEQIPLIPVKPRIHKIV